MYYESKRFADRYGEMYSVRNHYLDSGVAKPFTDDYAGWYEYRIYQVNSNGQIVKEWDSLYETYNGCQRLDKKQAKEALKDIIEMDDLFD
jgi:hypothetical protein